MFYVVFRNYLIYLIWFYIHVQYFFIFITFFRLVSLIKNNAFEDIVYFRTNYHNYYHHSTPCDKVIIANEFIISPALYYYGNYKRILPSSAEHQQFPRSHYSSSNDYDGNGFYRSNYMRALDNLMSIKHRADALHSSILNSKPKKLLDFKSTEAIFFILKI